MVTQFKFTRSGKVVECNGTRVAEAVNETWASVLVAMLNRDANRVGDAGVNAEFQRGVM